jgi:hypothetical protein
VGGLALRFYVEELEGLFEGLVEYYRSLLRLEARLRGIQGGEEGLVEVLRWRMAVARLLMEQRRVISSVRGGSMVQARSEACILYEVASRLLRDAPDPSISFHAMPMIAGVYEISRAICEHQGY